MGRWTKTPGKPSEETYDCTLYGTEVFHTRPDKAAKQLRHANEQLAIAGAYPGRGRAATRQNYGPPYLFTLNRSTGPLPQTHNGI